MIYVLITAAVVGVIHGTWNAWAMGQKISVLVENYTHCEHHAIPTVARRMYHGMAFVHPWLIMCGGDPSHQSSCKRLDITAVNRQWVDAGNPVTSKKYFDSVVFRGAYYAVGGDFSADKVDRYDPIADQWENVDTFK